MKKLLTASLLTLVLFTACKKDPQPAVPSLKGKWTIENMLYKEYLGGSLDNTYTEPGAGGTIDFQNNGNVVSTIAGNPVQTSPYTIKPDSKVEIDGENYANNMPAQNYLTDQQIADVLTYVRGSFGNKASAISSAEVKTVRASIK